MENTHIVLHMASLHRNVCSSARLDPHGHENSSSWVPDFPSVHPLKHSTCNAGSGMIVGGSKLQVFPCVWVPGDRGRTKQLAPSHRYTPKSCIIMNVHNHYFSCLIILLFGTLEHHKMTAVKYPIFQNDKQRKIEEFPWKILSQTKTLFVPEVEKFWNSI